MSRRRHCLVLLVTALLLAGCQDATDPSTDGPDDQDQATTSDQAVGADDASAAPAEELPPRLPLPDAGEVVLETPTQDVGPFPTLAWQAVPDAHRYHVSVIDSDGRAMWAWTTSDTQVVLGGYEQPPPEHVRGPRLHAPMHWHVLARDAEGWAIAQSGLRPIAP